MNSRVLRAFTLMSCLSTPALAAQQDPVSAADESAASPIGQDDQVYLLVEADGIPISNALEGYSSRAGLYLPVGELARLLDLAIYVDPLKRKASGWVIDQNRPFDINLANGTARGQGQELVLRGSDAVLLNGEIYVRAEVLQRLLPIDLASNLSEMDLRIHTRETLPFKARLDRTSRRPVADQTSGGIPISWIDQRYRFAAPPSFDLTLSGEAGNHSPTMAGAYDLRLGTDLLFAGFQLFAASDMKGRLDSVRMLFERKDPTGSGMAGPFGITRINFGDTNTPGLPLGAQIAGGRGFFLTSESLEQASIFDRTDIRGELPAGYQVELYVNEVLRGSESNTADGRYTFTEVPLSYGSNVIRLVFYGPRGERREEVRRINFTGNQLAAGKTTYSFGIVEENRQLVEVRPVPDAVRAALPGYGQPRLVGRFAHGLSNGITMTGGFAHFSPLTGDSRNLISAGLLASLGGMTTELDVAWDDSHARALTVGLAGRPAGISFVLQHSEYSSRFYDENQPLGAVSGTPLVRATSMRSDFALHLNAISIPIALVLRRDELLSRREYLSGGIRTSLLLGTYLFSTSLEAQQQRGGGRPTQANISGSSDLTGIILTNWQLRASANYQIVPTTRLISSSLTGDKRLSGRFNLRLGITHYFGDHATTALQAGITRQLKFAYLTLNSAYVTNTHDLRVGLQLSLGGLFDPILGRYRVTPPGPGVGGNVAIQAFEDTNGNGRRDAGEAPVANVKIQSASRTIESDQDGHALAYALGDPPTSMVEVQPDSLQDPYMRLDHPRWRLVPRPGQVAVVNLAFSRGGEVMIQAEFDEAGGRPRGVAGLSLQLLNEQGDIGFEGRSEFDGSLLAEGMRPGTYHVALNPQQAHLLCLALEGDNKITIAKGGGFSGSLKLRVVRQTSCEER